jgi:predicted PurR-regulated permease PerM
MVIMTGWRTRRGRTSLDDGGVTPDDQADVADDELSGQDPPPEGVGRRLRAAVQAFRQRAQAAAPPAADAPAEEYQPVPRDPAGNQVPYSLQRAAAWSWRLLLVGLLIYVAFRLASTLRLVVLPCIAALLLTALLQPLTKRLRNTGMPALAATWCTVLAVIIVLAGLMTLAVDRISADYPTLVTEVKHTAHDVQLSLAGPPFHLNSLRLEQLTTQLTDFLTKHQSQVAGTVLTGGKIFLELLTGLVLMVFVTFFLLKDGELIWTWLLRALSPQARRRADNAGAAAWSALVNYVRGTTAVAAIHAIFIGLALLILGVPLLVPLIILVFLAAYVPLIGILVAGALAILVTLGTKGWLAAVILLAVFLAENQIESHLLQPLVVGRIVRLHPLAIILVLAVGGIIAGIAGAIVAVPAAAALSYAWPHLRRNRAGPPGSSGPPAPPPAAAPGPAGGAAGQSAG